VANAVNLNDLEDEAIPAVVQVDPNQAQFYAVPYGMSPIPPPPSADAATPFVQYSAPK
jgi:hypothetical protein